MSNETLSVDAVVIGAGPGGYVCGIRLGQLKVRALVVEKAQPGGVCLNVGCIPSKALINAAKQYDWMKRRGADLGLLADGVRVDMGKLQAWKGEVVHKLTSGVRQLLKTNGCDYRVGAARIVDRNTVELKGAEGTSLIKAQHIVVATGSRPVDLPHFPLDGNRVVDSTGALAFTEVPERLLVVGAGYIGLEIGTLYAKLGSKVTVLEARTSFLPGNDPDVSDMVARKLKKLGVQVLVNARAKEWKEAKPEGPSGKAHAKVWVDTPDGVTTVEADKVLVAVGRRPNSEGLGLESLGVKTEKGFVVVDAQGRTNVRGIYAIGDVVGAPMLAHKASKEAEVVAEVIAGRNAAMDVRTIPSVMFTDPEVASAGLTASEAEARGHKVKVGKFPFVALGRALANADTDGFVKVVIDAESREILGVHAVGSGAADIISEGALAIEMGALAEDVGLTVHPHPTLPEAIMEAARAALGEAIHIPNR